MMFRLASILALAALAPHNTLAFAPSQTAKWTSVKPLVATGRPASAPQQPLKSAANSRALYMTASVAGDSDSDSENESESESETGFVNEPLPPGTATVQQLCFNLIKGIVGAGVLSLPAGISSFANAPSAVFPAVALIAVIGALSGYGFALIGRVCAYTNSKSYREAWSATVGEKTSWIPAVAVTFKTFCAILAYSMILGDTFVSLLATLGITAAPVPTLIGVTSVFLLPLCLLKNLSSLAPFSLVGTLGMLYTAVAMIIRFVGKSYVAPAGKFAADCAPALRPSFGTIGAEGIFTPSAAILVGMLSTAYMAHFNAPKFYNELKERTLPNYYKVVSTSFATSISIFAMIAAMGFLTFGSASSGLILNNYSTKDTLMGFSRAAVAVSLVFSYPLAFVGLRDGVVDLLKLKSTTKMLNLLTVALLSFVTFSACIIPDVSFVLAFGGATLGNALIYVFPFLMFRKAIKNKKDATNGQKREVKLAMGSAGIGIGMGLLGAKMALGTL